MSWIIRQEGWATPVGSAAFRSVLEQTSTVKGLIVWERWHAERVDLTRPAYMLALQGMALTSFFRDSSLERKSQRITGPFLLLKCKSDQLWSAVASLQDVVLARVLEAPDLAPQEVLGALVTRVLRA